MDANKFTRAQRRKLHRDIKKALDKCFENGFAYPNIRPIKFHNVPIYRAVDFDGNEHTGYLIDDPEYGFNLYELKNGRPPVITPVDPTTAERVGSAQWCLDLKNSTGTVRQLYQEISPTVIDCCFQLSQEA